MAKIKVLSIQQPIAYLFSIGAKLNETRSFATKFRGTLYIHASQKFYFSDLEVCRQDVHFKKFIPNPTDGKTLIISAIIGTVEIVDCVPTESIRKKVSKQERTFGNYNDGRYAWIGKNHTPLKTPILNVSGMLGIWNYDLGNGDEFDHWPDDEGPEPDLMGPNKYEFAERMASYQRLK